MRPATPPATKPAGWRLGRSFGFAIRGLILLVRTQANARIHLVATVIVVGAGFLVGLSKGEWCAVAAAIGLVWTAEGLNTAIEAIVDLVSPEYHDLAGRAKDAPIVVLTHRPLFPLYPQWDWATRDGEAAIALLSGHANVTVFYGHVHHEHHHMTGHIGHHAALAVMFPLSPLGSAAQKTQLPWDDARPFKGLGWRSVELRAAKATPREQSIATA